VPSREWICHNCEVTDEIKEWIDKLPGSYTLVLTLKHKKMFPDSLTKGLDTIGVRIPDHWIKEFVEEYGAPIVTTSANKSGEMFMTCIEDLDHDIKSHVNFIVYEGVKNGKPSKIIDLTVKR
jgi:tRNA threonylcarbamoyl adenosine modification protein (Sua5/YciO/YrdC/YwlC family)